MQYSAGRKGLAVLNPTAGRRPMPWRTLRASAPYEPATEPPRLDRLGQAPDYHAAPPRGGQVGSDLGAQRRHQRSELKNAERNTTAHTARSAAKCPTPVEAREATRDLARPKAARPTQKTMLKAVARLRALCVPPKGRRRSAKEQKLPYARTVWPSKPLITWPITATGGLYRG